MLVVLNKDNYNKDKINILERTKNNVISNGYFYRITYNDINCCLNGIYIFFNLKGVKIENYFNKYKCVFNNEINKEIIEFLKLIEKQIMNKHNFEGYKPKYRIEEQLLQHFIKIYSNINLNISRSNDMEIILKISGIWSEKNMYGITFRFFLPICNE